MKTRKIQKKFRHIGICAAAEELGVTVMHLWYVLHGIRQSRRIENCDWFKQTKAAKAEFERQSAADNRETFFEKQNKTTEQGEAR